MTKKNRKILLIIMGISLFCDLLIVGLFLTVAARPWPETPIDYEDPESLYAQPSVQRNRGKQQNGKD